MKKANKILLLLASVSLVVTAMIGTTIAFLTVQTVEVTNTFTPAVVDSEVVEETFHGTTKTDVKIQNSISSENGGVDAYIRAKVVITWQDADGNVAAEKPLEGKDYSIEGTPDTGWVKGADGFWYWTSKVAPEEHTGVLIQELKQIQKKDGYNLHVEILAEAIQADGVTNKGVPAVVDAWGFENGGSVTGIAAEKLTVTTASSTN